MTADLAEDHVHVQAGKLENFHHFYHRLFVVVLLCNQTHRHVPIYHHLHHRQGMRGSVSWACYLPHILSVAIATCVPHRLDLYLLL